VLTAEEIDLVIKYGLRPVLTFVSGKIEDFKSAKEDIQKVIDPAELDKLVMQESDYGGEWLPRDKLPENIRKLKFQITTSRFKYYMTKTGNLQRYPLKKATKDAD
jgi:hypothetical protein